MLMPSIFSRDFMDDLFDMPQRTYAKSYSANGLMKTDIKESEEGFTVEMDSPVQLVIMRKISLSVLRSRN
jgi:hypothetical protein